jgi:LmbE family N-acetylglucosaminyl deacetylase
MNPAEQGERAIIVYVTSGGAGILGKPPEEVCQIREAEGRAACEILRAEPLFLGLSDGSAFPTAEAVRQLEDLLEDAWPRAVFTSWPLDTHPDHRCTSYIAMEAFSHVFGRNFMSSLRDPLDAWDFPRDGRDDGTGPGLFLWQTMPGEQSMQFKPEVVVGIDATIDQKMSALEAHASQNRGDKLIRWAEEVAKGLARNLGGKYQYAEGFMRIRPPAF